MSVKVHISPHIVNSVASLYNDSNRIFMEYIDNAIDSCRGRRAASIMSTATTAPAYPNESA